jgi:5-methylcytosine-specific restriction enzyme A
MRGLFVLYDNNDKRLRGRAGQRRRERVLMLNPLCVICKRNNRVTAAVQVDHIKALSNGGADDESNLQGLCLDCHKTKTAQDLGYKIKRQVGIDGIPEGW